MLAVLGDLDIPLKELEKAANCRAAAVRDLRGLIEGIEARVFRAVVYAPSESHVLRGEHIVAALQQSPSFRLPLVVVATTSPGTYTDGPVRLHISSGGSHEVETDIVLPDHGIVRMDFRLTAVGVSRGTATITLRVTGDSGVSLPGGRVSVPKLRREVPVKDGLASITDMPPGSWAISVRSLGYNPQTAIIEAITGETTESSISLSRMDNVLDTVRVVSKTALRDSAVLKDIRARLLVAAGTLIQQDNLSLRSATEASDAIRVARGFIVKSPTRVEARPVTQGLATAPCASAASNTTMGRGKQVAVYLDGTRVPGGLESVNNMVRPNQILAIEAYPEVLSAPFLWRTNDTCAVIAFWTKH